MEFIKQNTSPEPDILNQETIMLDRELDQYIDEGLDELELCANAAHEAVVSKQDSEAESKLGIEILPTASPRKGGSGQPSKRPHRRSGGSPRRTPRTKPGGKPKKGGNMPPPQTPPKTQPPNSPPKDNPNENK